MRRPPTLILMLTLGAIAFTIGIYGNWRLYPMQENSGYFTYISDTIYRTFSLFFFGAEQDLSSRLFAPSAGTSRVDLHIYNIARLLAPLTLAGALLKILSDLISPHYNRFCIRRRQDQILIYGSGELALRFIEQNAGQGQKISVVIPDSAKMSTFSKWGLSHVRAYIGAGNQTDTWKATNAKSATVILLLHDDDRKNIAAMKTISQYGRIAQSTPMLRKIRGLFRSAVENKSTRVFTHIANPALRLELVRQTGAFRAPPGYTFEPVAIGEVAARQFFITRDFFADTILRGHTRVHWLVFGLSANSVSFLHHFLRVCPYPGSKDSTPPYEPNWPKITLFCRKNHPHLNEFAREMKRCERFVDFSHYDACFSTGSVPDELHDKLAKTAASHVLISDLEGREMALALELRGRTQREKIPYLPIYYSEFDDTVLSDLFENGSTTYIQDEVVQISLMNDLCKIDLLTEHIDALATTLHNEYLPELEHRDTKKPSHVDWAELGETYRASNRRAAAHAKTKAEYLSLYGSMHSISAHGFTSADISPDQRDALSRAEHYSWWIDHLLMGWVHKDTRNDVCRHHNNMIEFNDLNKVTQNYDVQQVNTILDLLENNPKTNESLKPRLLIGMIGHNQIGSSDADLIKTRLRNDILPRLLRENPNCNLRFLTPLAPGSDLIMAQTVQEFMRSKKHIPYDIVHIQTVDIDDLVSGYIDYTAAGHIWSHEESVSEVIQSEPDQFEQQIRQTLISFQETITVLDLRTIRIMRSKDKFSYNADYFSTQPDILIAFQDENREGSGSVGVKATVRLASSQNMRIIFI